MSSTAVLRSVRHLRRILAAQSGQEQSDAQLLSAFAGDGDEDAFAALVRRHGPMVLGVCRRVLGHEQDAEDAFQATFLVLAQRAASLRDKTALSSFLYGTSFHLASTAKRAAGRRRKHEGQAPPRASADPSDTLLWSEVRTVLDEEIARLPEIYRSVFVLCCLQEMGRAAAARLLGLKEATLLKRLTTARKRLRDRLARRGVELTALLAALAVETPSASALPAGLTATTVNSALTVIADGSAALSPAIAAMMPTGSPILNLGKLKLAMLILLAAAASGSLVGWYGSASGPLAATTEPPAAKKEDKAKPALPQQPAAKAVQIHGRVLGPDGKPKAGVKLLLLRPKVGAMQLGEGEIAELGVSAADGQFSIMLPGGGNKSVRTGLTTRNVHSHFTSTMPGVRNNGQLIAQAEGSGIDFRNLAAIDPQKAIEFRLVKDQAIRGRIVNTEGKPVAGVRVLVTAFGFHPNQSLDSFLVSWKKRHFMSPIPWEGLQVWFPMGALFAATTDADGRFSLHGVGAERLVNLRLSGGGIADSEQWVVNRNGFDAKPYNQAMLDNIPKGMEQFSRRWQLRGPQLSIVAEAEKPIRGIVTAADTGKPRPGVVVQLLRREGGYASDISLRARTDAQGRYEIHGSPKARRYMLGVASDAATGYLSRQVWIDDTAGYQPVMADIAQKKGVIITGKIIDKATGKPIPGFAMIHPLINNPFVKDDPAFSWNDSCVTGADFTFRVVSIPGHVLLMGGPHFYGTHNRFEFKAPLPDPKYPQYFTKDPKFVAFFGPGGAMSPLQGNFCKVLEIRPDAKIVKQDIVLERGSVLPVRIQDADGKPLAGVWVAGSSPREEFPAIQCPKAECSVYELEKGKPRLLVLFHPDRKLAGTLTLKGDEKSPVVAKLRPAAAIKGRLLDADGKALAGVVVDLTYHQRTAWEVHQVIHRAKQIVSDANGTFTLDDLIPEQNVELSFRQGKRAFTWAAKAGEATILKLKPGECRDLRDGRLKRKQ